MVVISLLFGALLSFAAPGAQPSGAASADILAIAAGDFHTCAVTSGGGVECFGLNDYGQLGDGTNTGPQLCNTTACSDTPVVVSGLSTGVSAVAAGGDFTCALTSGGGVECWGRNNWGQLGNGTTTDSSVPVAVSGLSSGVAAISAGNGTACALTSSGSVACWGLNALGQLGNGTISGPQTCDSSPCSETPVPVSGLSSGVVAITVGNDHNCALAATQALECWGLNNYGQLGDGTMGGSATCEAEPCADTPVPVSVLSSTVAAISAGDGFNCVLTSGGGVECWGWNGWYQLGDGSGDTSVVPVSPSGLSSGVSAIDVGGDSLSPCAAMSSGGVECWGNNSAGQLGDATATGSVPVIVSGLSSAVSAISGGYMHNCALTTTHAVECWGDDRFGQLGDGVVATESAVAVTALTGDIDTVTFNGNGGSSVAPLYAVDGGTITLPGAPSNPGYAFTGWNTAPDGSGASYGAGASYAVNGPVTLYAEWAFDVSIQPMSHYYVTGQSLTFTAGASATPAPTVQWQYSFDHGKTWADLSGATSATLSVGPLNAFVNHWEVRAAFTNVVATTITSNPATMTFTPTYIAYPSDGTTVSGTAYNDAVAPSGVPRVLFELSGGTLNHAVIGAGSVSLIGWFGGWNTTTVPNGTYTLQSAVSSGGVNELGPGVSITVNNPPPTTTVLLPANNSNVVGQAILDASASSGVTQVQYEISGGGLTNKVIASGTPTLYGWLAAWNTTGITNGTYTLQSVASYGGGVSGTSAPITITVSN
jgi:alpha-tubulin suppressor-like RCC1 family protein